MRGTALSIGGLVLCAWLAAVGCDRPPVGESPASTGQGIVGGTPTTDRDSVVLIFTGAGVCTGAVVAPDVVLTAAHCLDGVWGTVEVYWGDDLVDGVYDDTRYSNEYHVHPQYDAATLAHDIGALKLSESSPTDPIPINCDPPDASWVDPADPLAVVGFGMIYPDPQVGLKLEAPVAFDSWDADFLFHADPDHGFCRGDAGAPVLTDHGGDWAVAAVASHANVHCVDYGAATRTDPHVGWLEGLFPGWDVCGGAGDDDTTGDDDSAGDDDTSGEDDDTSDGEDQDAPPDCGCDGDGGNGGVVISMVAGLFVGGSRRRLR